MKDFKSISLIILLAAIAVSLLLLSLPGMLARTIVRKTKKGVHMASLGNQKGYHVISHLSFIIWFILAVIGAFAIAGMDVQSLLQNFINKIPSFQEIVDAFHH